MAFTVEIVFDGLLNNISCDVNTPKVAPKSVAVNVQILVPAVSFGSWNKLIFLYLFKIKTFF